MQYKKIDKFYIFSMFSGILILFFIMFPIISSLTWTDFEKIKESFMDIEVLIVIFRSIKTAFISSIICLIFSVPFSYFLSRRNFKFKNIIESIIDIPMVLPHTVAGIVLLTVLSKKSFIGNFFNNYNIDILGSEVAIVIAMVFVSLPIMFNASKEAFKWIPIRLENTSRVLGASRFQTFIDIVLPLSYKDILSGFILTFSRSISEFGAVVILAYHPMIAPTLIYDRFANYGIAYAMPIAIILLMISLLSFIFIRALSLGTRYEYNDRN